MADQVRKHGISPQAAARRIVGLLDRPKLELIIPRHYRMLDVLKLCVPSIVHGPIARQSRPKGKAPTGESGYAVDQNAPATEG